MYTTHRVQIIKCNHISALRSHMCCIQQPAQNTYRIQAVHSIWYMHTDAGLCSELCILVGTKIPPSGHRGTWPWLKLTQRKTTSIRSVFYQVQTLLWIVIPIKRRIWTKSNTDPCDLESQFLALFNMMVLQKFKGILVSLTWWLDAHLCFFCAFSAFKAKPQIPLYSSPLWSPQCSRYCMQYLGLATKPQSLVDPPIADIRRVHKPVNGGLHFLVVCAHHKPRTAFMYSQRLTGNDFAP